MEIEVASKPPLMADGCVTIRFKMLTYYRVRSSFKPDCALPSTIIEGLEATSNLTKKGYL
jgi:hypothetical protein